MSEPSVAGALTRWQRLVLVAFLVDIMVVYPSVNRVEENSMANRLLLAFLIGLVFLAFLRQWWRAMTRAWDLPTTLLIGYLLWISLSLAGSVAFGQQSPDSLLTYGLNSLAPLILYACFIDFPERRFLVLAILWLTLVNIAVGVMTLTLFGLAVPGLTPFLQQLVFDPDNSRLGSLVGKSTVIGYLAVFGFTWALFNSVSRWRYPLLALFGFATLLSFQRSMWGGLLLAFGLYLLFARRNVERRIVDATVAAVILPGVVVLLIAVFDLSVLNRLIVDRFAEFDPHTAIVERGDQQLVLNYEDPLHILVGEGYGKYSPLNKDENVLNLPDAPLHMIYNETGIIGLGLFVGVLVAFACRALARRNLLLFWLVIHLSIVLLGSRILWYFPLNFVIPMLLAVYKDDSDDAPPARSVVPA